MFRPNEPRFIPVLFLMALAAVLFFGLSKLGRLAAEFSFKQIKTLKALGSPPSFSGIFQKNKETEELVLENRELKEKLRDLEAAKGLLEFTVKIQEESKGTIAALILLRPPALAYDQLIVDKGKKDGVVSGNLVLVGPNIILGKVAEVFEETSRVISFSSHGLEENVFLQEAGISASASGLGNYEFAITLPRDFPAETGDQVFSLTDPPYLVGSVEKISSESSASTKKLTVRQPFNIYNLRQVNILK